MPKLIEDAANNYKILPETEANDPPLQIQYAMQLLAAYAQISGLPIGDVMQQMADGTFPYEQYQEEIDATGLPQEMSDQASPPESDTENS